MSKFSENYQSDALLFFICSSSFLLRRLVSHLISSPNTSSPISTKAVATIARIYIPPPQARPIAAVTHTPAAVVSPLITFSLLWNIIVPAPMKPMPVTTCAAIRATSQRCSSPSSMPSKPYADTIINSAEPIATRKCVRKPASLARYSRSRPMAPPSIAATKMRSINSHVMSILQMYDFYWFCEYNFLKKMIIRNAVIHTTSLRSILIISISSINVRHLRCLDFVSTTFRPWKCQICLEKNVIHHHRPRKPPLVVGSSLRHCYHMAPAFHLYFVPPLYLA